MGVGGSEVEVGGWGPSAAERRGNNKKQFNDFNLNAKTRIWPGLSYMCWIRSTVDPLNLSYTPTSLDSRPHSARPVRLIITMIEWFRTSRLSIKNSLWTEPCARGSGGEEACRHASESLRPYGSKSLGTYKFPLRREKKARSARQSCRVSSPCTRQACAAAEPKGNTSNVLRCFACHPRP